MSIKEDAKFYWVRCSDGVCLAMSEERLERIFDLMPTLRYLLVGHPNMKAKEPRELPDGTLILDIPSEFKVSQKAFLQLINCILEVEPLPPRVNQNDDNSSLSMLTHTMATLGGCEVLEQRLKDHHANPLTPEEDINNDYDWHVVGMEDTGDIRTNEMTQLADAGYTCTKSTFDGVTVSHLYRKKRG